MYQKPVDGPSGLIMIADSSSNVLNIREVIFFNLLTFLFVICFPVVWGVCKKSLTNLLLRRRTCWTKSVKVMELSLAVFRSAASSLVIYWKGLEIPVQRGPWIWIQNLQNLKERKKKVAQVHQFLKEDRKFVKSKLKFKSKFAKFHHVKILEEFPWVWIEPKPMTVTTNWPTSHHCHCTVSWARGMLSYFTRT